MGFRSGEYGGRNTSLIFSSAAASNVFIEVCILALSTINTIVSNGLCRRIRRNNVIKSSLLALSLIRTTSLPFSNMQPKTWNRIRRIGNRILIGTLPKIRTLFGAFTNVVSSQKPMIGRLVPVSAFFNLFLKSLQHL